MERGRANPNHSEIIGEEDDEESNLCEGPREVAPGCSRTWTTTLGRVTSTPAEKSKARRRRDRGHGEKRWGGSYGVDRSGESGDEKSRAAARQAEWRRSWARQWLRGGVVPSSRNEAGCHERDVVNGGGGGGGSVIFLFCIAGVVMKLESPRETRVVHGPLLMGPN